MKLTKLKKVFALSALTIAVSACVESDGNQELYADSLSPVQVATPTWEITVPEDTPAGVIDLLHGVTNPEDTVMYPRDFMYHRVELDAEGLPVQDQDGNDVLLFEGPELPVTTVLSTTQYMRVDPTDLADLLFHPHTVAKHEATRDMNGDGVDDEGWEPIYSQGKYNFSYVIDNGADETVTRNITLTVTASEVKAEEIEIITEDNFEAPISFETVDGEVQTTSYPINLTANLIPSNATYNQITYSSSDTSIATVSSLGVVTGVSLGDFVITITSEDGSISNTVAGIVSELSDPVGIQVINDDESDMPSVLTNATVAAGGMTDLDYQLLPVSYDWTGRDVTWSVEDDSKITIDEDGVITGVSIVDVPRVADQDMTADDYDTTSVANVTTVTATIAADTTKTFETQVEVVVGNVLYNGNPNFDKAWDDEIIAPREESDQLNAATYEIRDDANSIDGPSLWTNTADGDLRIKFKAAGLLHNQFVDGADYLLSYDVHLISGQFQGFLNPSVGGWHPFPANWSRVNLGDYDDNSFRAEHVYPASKIIKNGTMLFNLHVSQGSEVYLDNFKLEVIEP